MDPFLVHLLSQATLESSTAFTWSSTLILEVAWLIACASLYKWDKVLTPSPSFVWMIERVTDCGICSQPLTNLSLSASSLVRLVLVSSWTVSLNLMAGKTY